MIKLVVALFTVLSLMTSTALAADVFKDACAQAPSSTVCQDNAAQNGANTNPVNHIIHVATDIVAVLVGLAAVVMIIISGFKFVTAAGSAESVKSARQTLIAALIGLAIAGLAWTLINFAVDKLITT